MDSMSQPIRVVVVEDIDLLREHFCSLVNNETDMEVVGQASSGEQFWQLIQQVDADVVLMDIELEVKHDGIIAAKKILKHKPNIRIVFLTVHEDDETVFSAFETGAVDYVLKTVDSSEIVKSIRSAKMGLSQVRPEIAYKIRNEFIRIRQNEENLFNAMKIMSQLTPTEIEVLHLLLKDLKTNEIAKKRQVEVSTIKSQINVILKKFKKKRSKEVIALLKELNLVQFIQKANL